MEKEFIPYEQALALKELGFDEPCFGLYENKKIGYSWETSQGIVTPITYRRNSKFVEHILSKGDCTSPTFSQSFRWFRENHNLMFQIYYLRNGNYAVLIHRTTSEYMDLVDQIKPSSGCVDEVVDCYSYEEAELACLIKLIEIVKNKVTF